MAYYVLRTIAVLLLQQSWQKKIRYFHCHLITIFLRMISMYILHAIENVWFSNFLCGTSEPHKSLPLCAQNNFRGLVITAFGLCFLLFEIYRGTTRTGFIGPAMVDMVEISWFTGSPAGSNVSESGSNGTGFILSTVIIKFSFSANFFRHSSRYLVLRNFSLRNDGTFGWRNEDSTRKSSSSRLLFTIRSLLESDSDSARARILCSAVGMVNYDRYHNRDIDHWVHCGSAFTDHTLLLSFFYYRIIGYQ
jgi:hypothetical protein